MRYLAAATVMILLIASVQASAQPAYQYNDRIDYNKLRYEGSESSKNKYPGHVPQKRYKEKRYGQWNQTTTTKKKKEVPLATAVTKELARSTKRTDIITPKASEYKKPKSVVPPRPTDGQ